MQQPTSNATEATDNGSLFGDVRKGTAMEVSASPAGTIFRIKMQQAAPSVTPKMQAGRSHDPDLRAI